MVWGCPLVMHFVFRVEDKGAASQEVRGLEPEARPTTCQLVWTTVIQVTVRPVLRDRCPVCLSVTLV